MLRKLSDLLDQFCRRLEIARENRREFRELYEVPHWWHVSDARSALSFNHFGTYAEALDEMRARAPGASVVHVDHEWKAIFFRLPKS